MFSFSVRVNTDPPDVETHFMKVSETFTSMY